MKKIGILLREYDNYKKLDKDFISYLKDYNVCLIAIVYDDNTNFDKIIEALNLCDGIIMPGGSEDLPKNVSIARYLYTINKPTLGICLGMQNMAEASFGLLEKLDTDSHNTNKEYAHKVRIKKDSYLYKILGSSNILVNSRHNYNVIKTSLEISAYSDDFVIEAIEDKTKKFYVGVQWHPESLSNDLNSKLLIEEFIRKC